ncbi:MAG: hypothetical protein J4F36_11335 [Nitrosopumilaceae archaeon]|nr:hypothetical protein [Nitrosopumilaceae archaeon]
MTKRKEKELLFFQSRFALYILVIGILVAFSLHSMTEDRIEWAVGWEIAALASLLLIRQYQEKKVREIHGENLLTEFSIREFTPMTGGKKTDVERKKQLRDKLLSEIENIQEIKNKTRGKKLSVFVRFYLYDDPKQHTRYEKDIDNMLKIFCDVLPDYSDKEKTISGIGLIEEDDDHMIFEVNAVKELSKMNL